MDEDVKPAIQFPPRAVKFRDRPGNFTEIDESMCAPLGRAQKRAAWP